MKTSDLLVEYKNFLLDYNQKVNLVSRKITSQGLQQLLVETEMLHQYISPNLVEVVDAGSGNGLLGIPVAIWSPDKKVVLVEPIKKKALFLQLAAAQLCLKNVEIRAVSIEEYLKKWKSKNRSLIARGFPELSVFCRYIINANIREAVLITSDNKIKKNHPYLESVKKKTYNVPLRENLKILKMEKAST